MVARAGRRRAQERIVAREGIRGVREGARRKGREDGHESRKMESTREDCRASRENREKRSSRWCKKERT